MADLSARILPSLELDRTVFAALHFPPARTSVPSLTRARDYELNLKTIYN